MASNLDYLNPDLLPLEDAVKNYLAAEEELRKLGVARQSQPAHSIVDAQAAAGLLQDRADADRSTAEQDQHARHLEQELARRHQQVLDLLPGVDEWVKVNLGYGPSRVGAWRVPAEGGGERLQVRVVH